MNFIKQLESLILEEIENGAFPGANYALVYKNEVYIGSLGNRRILPNIEKNNIDTVYDMASLSKVVSTTSCIMKLLEMGKIRLFSKVVDYLPNFKHKNITVWHLMTHTSGLPEGLKNLFSYSSSDDILSAIYNIELIYNPGTEIRYSDLGYILLGKIVEVISKMRLDEFANQVLFKPLGMSNTGYNLIDISKCAPTEERHDLICDGIVCGHVHDETSYLLGGIAGHAGLFSDIKDISHFIQMILNDGIYLENRIFEKTTIDRLFKVEVMSKNGVMNNQVSRGLGWMIAGQAGPNGELTSDKTIHHTGFTGTSIWIDKENKIGFCLLTNRVHPTRNNVKHIDARARIANFIMANYQYLREENK